VSDERHLPYDRVPLSKDYLVDRRARERVFLRTREFYDKEKIEIISGSRATKLDVKAKTITLDNDAQVTFRRLLLAMGGRPRVLQLPGPQLSGIHYLRTLDDCDEIKEEMSRSRSALVIGGGFIGCELASAFATRGLSTTMIEAAAYPLNVAVSEETGRWVADYFRSKGVNVMTNTQVSRFVGTNGKVEAAVTSSGEELKADFVAVGIGIIPNTEIAQQAGLKVDRGIVVNEYLQTDVKDIYAAGDVARFFSPIFNRHLRVEHYDVAAKQGMVAGANLVGEEKPFVELPFFYSFMFDLRINAYGDLGKKTRIVTRGSMGAERGFFQLYFDDGVLNGFLSINRSFQEVNELRRIILSRKSFEDLSRFEDESKGLEQLQAM